VRSAQSVVSSSEAVAFRKRRGSGATARNVTYACMRGGAGPIIRLKRSEEGGSRVRPLLAGRYVAYRRVFFLNEFGSASGLVVQDMRTGAVGLELPYDESNLHSYVVKRNGSVAWLDLPEDAIRRRLWKADRSTGGEPQLLDSGTEIDADSLRLSTDRRRVLWTRDGAQSAPIN
jgi:hypothetical protein